MKQKVECFFEVNKKMCTCMQSRFWNSKLNYSLKVHWKNNRLTKATMATVFRPLFVFESTARRNALCTTFLFNVY